MYVPALQPDATRTKKTPLIRPLITESQKTRVRVYQVQNNGLSLLRGKEYAASLSQFVIQYVLRALQLR